MEERREIESRVSEKGTVQNRGKGKIERGEIIGEQYMNKIFW